MHLPLISCHYCARKYNQGTLNSFTSILKCLPTYVLAIYANFTHISLSKLNFYIFPYPLKLIPFKISPFPVVFCTLHSGFTVDYIMYLAKKKINSSK